MQLLRRQKSSQIKQIWFFLKYGLVKIELLMQIRYPGPDSDPDPDPDSDPDPDPDSDPDPGYL